MTLTDILVYADPDGAPEASQLQPDQELGGVVLRIVLLLPRGPGQALGRGEQH